jgi:hypothetical protein
MDSRFSDVVLQIGADQVYKMVELRKAGFVDGRLLDESGEAMDGVRVGLRHEQRDEEYEALTNEAGEWLLPRVPIGSYRVTFGDPDRPLSPAESLEFGGGSLRYPDRRVPRGASIVVRAVDARGEPLVGATVTGFERAGGPFDAITEEHGVVIVRYLAPGSYVASVAHPNGRHGRTNIRLSGEEDQMIFQVVCREVETDPER